MHIYLLFFLERDMGREKVKESSGFQQSLELKTQVCALTRNLVLNLVLYTQPPGQGQAISPKRER